MKATGRLFPSASPAVAAIASGAAAPAVAAPRTDAAPTAVQPMQAHGPHAAATASPVPSAMFVGVAAVLLFAGFRAWRVARRRRRPAAPAHPAGSPSRAVAAAGVAPDHPAAGNGVGAADASAVPTGYDRPMELWRIDRAVQAVALDANVAEEPSAQVPAAHGRIVARALESLGCIETQPKYMPRRPQLLPQLMQAVNDEHASLRSVAAIIARDPTLAGNLLRVANSPLYRVQPRPLENIERAVAMLGTSGLRRIIVAALMQPVTNTSSGAFARFPLVLWEHSQQSAIAAAEHASHVEDDDAFAAQLLGLLYGLGAIAVVQVLRDEYAKQPGLVADANVAVSLLDTCSAATARRIGMSWGLSDRIANALEGQAGAGPSATVSPLARSLRFGRAAAGLAALVRLGRLEQAAAAEALAGCGAPPHVAAAVLARLNAHRGDE